MKERNQFLQHSALTVLAAAAMMAAQVCQAGELKEFAVAALQNDQQLKIAGAQQSAQLESKSLGEAGLKPVISASASIQETTITSARSGSNTVISTPGGGSTVISGGNQSYQSTSYGASVQQPIFDWEAIQAYRRGRVDATLASLTYQTAEQNLFYRLIDAYLMVISAQSTIETDQNLVLSNEREVKRQEKGLSAGLSTSTDLLTAQAALNAAKTQVIADQINSDAADSALSLITGVTKKVSSRVADDLPLALPSPQNLSFWQELATNANPGILSARKTLEAATLQRKAAQSGYLPKLVGVGGYSSNKTDTDNSNDNSSYYYGLSVSMPLYNGGATSAKLRQASASYDAIATQLALVTKQVANNVVLHYNAIYSGIDGVRTAIASVQANEANVVAFEASAKAGARSVTDSVIARSNLALSQKALTEANLRYIRSVISLKQDVGQMNMQQINEIDTFFIDYPRY